MIRTTLASWLTMSALGSAAGIDLGGLTLLSRDCEVEMALQAAPEHLRAGAAVYALGEDGFVKVRHGSNGFACIVNRDHQRTLKPTCYDAEGARTILPKVLFFGEQLAAGVTVSKISAAVKSAFAEGRFESPSRSGVAFMLSGFNRPNTGGDAMGWFPPHVMFYAPDVTSADIGYERGSNSGGGPALPFVAYQGPHGFIIMLSGDRTPPKDPLPGCPAWTAEGNGAR